MTPDINEPELVECEHCGKGYDPDDDEAVDEHTEPWNRGCCMWCEDKPRCYRCDCGESADKEFWTHGRCHCAAHN